MTAPDTVPPSPGPAGTVPPPRGAGGRRPAARTLHAVTFAVLLAYWTYMLLKRNPVPESLLPEFSWFDKGMLYFLLSKALHLGSYAFMAVLGGSLAPPGRRRTLVFGLLVLHGAATEFGQWIGNEYFDTNRHGCVRDVLIDTTGIALGAWVLRAAGNRFGRPAPAVAF